ncbi:MAG: type II toxin-antitoxin system RelE/ParE family toxin [Spirochaetaceae bacterium]|jgi:plasmid stabilization system protein ParE|nr:type II toxin-antitoxin system RelE/ParE family toxin [Spirochaetaceae bacterium]
MPEYTVDVTAEAEEDMNDIFLYISNVLQSPIAAGEHLLAFETAINSLHENPYRYPKSYDPFLAAKGYHRILVKNYIIFYTIDDESKNALVMRVIYGSRNLPDLL